MKLERNAKFKYVVVTDDENYTFALDLNGLIVFVRKHDTFDAEWELATEREASLIRTIAQDCEPFDAMRAFKEKHKK